MQRWLLRIRQSNNRAIAKYERKGTAIFLEALRRQAIPNQFNPQIMTNAYIEFYQYVYSDSATRQYYQIRENEKTKDFILNDFFLTTWKAWIKTYVETELVQVIAGVNQRTLEAIRTITAQGIADGLNPFQLAKLLRKEIGNKARSLAIARTEGTTANNMGTKRSAEDWQIQTGETLYKIWIHSGNARDPRPAHIQAQSKPIPKQQYFVINGSQMEFPGDKSAPLSELVSCLCTHTYLSERLAKKRFPDSF